MITLTGAAFVRFACAPWAAFVVDMFRCAAERNDNRWAKPVAVQSTGILDRHWRSGDDRRARPPTLIEPTPAIQYAYIVNEWGRFSPIPFRAGRRMPWPG